MATSTAPIVLLSVEQTAERLHLAPVTLRARIHEGTAPRSARIGGKRLFLESDVNAWIMQHFHETENSEN